MIELKINNKELYAKLRAKANVEMGTSIQAYIIELIKRDLGVEEDEN